MCCDKERIHTGCLIESKSMDIRNLTEQVKVLALEVGKYLQDECTKFDRSRVEKKSAHDYVSYVDKNSEQQIVDRLKMLLPEAGFIAEEGSGGHEEKELLWLVDPLDGTANFIHDNAPYCISIALRNRHEVLLGVVYECCRNELFWAYKGSKAYMNDEEIHVSSVDILADSFLELGFPHNSNAYRSTAVDLVNRLYGRVGGLRLMGAAAAELCYVACGRFEGRIEGLLGPWDIAAGSLILQQAGGVVTDFRGGADFYSGREVLATNGKIHSQLLEIVREMQF